MMQLTKWFLGRHRFAEFTRFLTDAGLVLREDSHEIQVVLRQASQLGWQAAAVNADTCRPSRGAAAATYLDDVRSDWRTAVRLGHVPRQTDTTGVRACHSQTNWRRRHLWTSTDKMCSASSVQPNDLFLANSSCFAHFLPSSKMVMFRRLSVRLSIRLSVCLFVC